jgi:DNA-binding GntR family transcriptional regulator
MEEVLQTDGAVQAIYLSVLDDLEQQRLVPGQRLVEGDLQSRFQVGRNTIREAMQRLESRGIVELSRHRSALIRQLSPTEASGVLDVAEAMLSLLSGTAAARFAAGDHDRVQPVLEALEEAAEPTDHASFAPVRRGFYRALVAIADNVELERLLPTVSTPVLYAQYRSRDLLLARARNYRSILAAVARRDAAAAQTASREHVAEVRELVLAEAPKLRANAQW